MPRRTIGAVSRRGARGTTSREKSFAVADVFSGSAPSLISPRRDLVRWFAIIGRFVLACALRSARRMATWLPPAGIRRPAAFEKLEHRLEGLVRLVKAEYLEMPGLYLTAAQAQRLWNLDAETCMSVLDALMADCFLVCTSNGNYRRFDAA